MTDHDKVRELILSKEQMPIALDTTRSALIIVDVQRFSPARTLRLHRFSAG